MARTGSRDFILCYYCPNEATEVVTVAKGTELLRRWVCRHHAVHLPTRRQRWLRRIYAGH
jgi:hypothetical protein